ncbi:MAG: ABC transporter permease [Spirochaetes bacterium]|nr:ABC transporter permease [Spirochaetota bacterium]
MAGIITLIVMPAFMYSGYLVPLEQMAELPKMIGNWFPLSHYLRSLYPVFNHRQDLSVVYPELNILWKYVGLFMGLSMISILIGQFEMKKILRRELEAENKKKLSAIMEEKARKAALEEIKKAIELELTKFQ